MGQRGRTHLERAQDDLTSGRRSEIDSRWKWTVALTVGLALPVVGAGAQAPTPASLRAGASRPAPQQSDPRPVVRAGAPRQRALLAAIGATVGTLAALGLDSGPANATPACWGEPGVCEALPGVPILAIIGSGLGAGLPTGTGACPVGRRLLRSHVGAAIGYGVGALVVTGLIGYAELGLKGGGPLGAAIGGAVAARRCRAP